VSRSDGNELLISARSVMMGYLNDAKSTQASLLDHKWLRTGDLATIHGDSLISIKGRLKDILITSTGAKMSPSQKEAEILAELPCLSNVVVVGDNQPHLVAFLALSVHDDGDQLSQSAMNWCKHVAESNVTSVSEILGKKDERIFFAIQVKSFVFSLTFLLFSELGWNRQFERFLAIMPANQALDHFTQGNSPKPDDH